MLACTGGRPSANITPSRVMPSLTRPTRRWGFLWRGSCHNVPMNYEWIGFLAAALTTGSFVPQAVMTIRTRNTSGISLAIYVIFTVGVAAWLVYGIAMESWPMIFANT